MSQNQAIGLRERKREATHDRIAGEAARLVLEQGVIATTVDQIGDAAAVGRASFFRYSDSKGLAIAAGFVGAWLHTETRRPLPPTHRPATRCPHRRVPEFGRRLHEIRDILLSQARISRSSVALSAWTLHVYEGDEEAIADALAPRFDRLERDDPRPRLLGAHAMTSIRLALDPWVAADGAIDLPLLIEGHLRSLATVAPPVLQPSTTTTRRTA